MRHSTLLPQHKGKRCKEPRPEWRLSCLQDATDQEYNASWELLRRKATYFSEREFSKRPWLSGYYEVVDLEQVLMLHIFQISLKPQYSNLDWVSFSKLLTVALPNRLHNLVTREHRIPYFSALGEEAETEFTQSQWPDPFATSHKPLSASLWLTTADLEAILASFTHGLKDTILDNLGDLPPLHKNFENLGVEVLTVLMEAKRRPSLSFDVVLRALGYPKATTAPKIKEALERCFQPWMQDFTISGVFELVRAEG